MSNNKLLGVQIVAIVLICFAAALRLYSIDTLPIILNPDEAAIGYNAYLLKETGMDEWGQRWPITLKSFGDYKLLGYPFFTVIAYYIFGESEFAIRVTSALAGIWLIVCMYLWNKRLLKSKFSVWFMTVLGAFTPIFFFYSRMAFEANLALAVMISVLLLVFREKDDERVTTDILAILLFAVATVTYNTPLLLLPCICIALIWWRGIYAWKKWILPLMGLTFVGIFAISMLREATAQKTAITIFSDPQYILAANDFRLHFNSLLQPLMRAELFFFLQILQRLYSSFTPNFLVYMGGAHPWHSLPYWGHIFGLQYILGVLGTAIALVSVLRKVFSKRFAYVLQPLQSSEEGWTQLTIFLLVSGLLPAIVTVDAPHATRSLLFFFCFVSIAGIGFEKMFSLSRSLQKRIRMPIGALFLWTCVLISTISTSTYLVRYFIWFPENHPKQLRVGFDSIIVKAAVEHPTGRIAIVDPDGTLYILASWYLRLQPTVFFETVRKQSPDQIGFRYGEQVSRFHFIAQQTDRTDETALIDRTSEESNWVILP